jgi:hypothetical protein
MRVITNTAAAMGAALLLSFAGASPSFAKAHDNGVANPKNDGMNTAAGGRGSQADNAPAIGQGGIGGAVNGGQRGDAASSMGSDNSRAGGVGGQK